MISLVPEILDASAFLAYLQDEPGRDRVEASLAHRALMGSVNYAETLTRLRDLGLEPAHEDRRLRNLGVVGEMLTLVPFSQEDAVRAAELRAVTRQLGLSLGDRACLALAQRLGRPVLTADRAWASLAVGVDVRLIRP